MEKVIELKSILVYKKAIHVLEDNNIKYDKAKLLNNPELCLDIVNIFNCLQE